MTKPIHHAILKRATRLGVTLHETPTGEFQIARGNSLSGAYPSAKEALDAYAVDPKAMEWTTFKSGRCGVMVAIYHDRYEHNAHGPGSCDGLDCDLRDAYTSDDGVDVAGLRTLGEELGLWAPNWETLNPGMQRMNLSNRIRAWLRNNADAECAIGSTTGRHGVAFRPAKSRRKAA